MKNYDLLILGPATRDENVDYDGRTEYGVGGAVIFCAPAARAANPNVFAAVKASPDDEADIRAALRMPEADCAILPSRKTTYMYNRYYTADRERRDAECRAQADAIAPAELPGGIAWKLAHLAGLVRGDFSGELIRSLKARGMLAADMQGFLRCNEGGRLTFHDWPEKLEYLPYFDILKTDAREAEVLTGLTDRAAAARQMHDWGAKEVMVSHNSEMLVFDGKTVRTCPVRARNLSGRTGRGDTTFGAYLAMRLSGADIGEALLYATACVSLKMETPGTFAGTRADVEAYIREFY